MDTNLDIDKAVGQSLAKHRFACSMTQAEVAEHLGLSVDAISRMERGTISLTMPRLIQFAELFRCNMSDFVIESSPIVDEQAKYISTILQPLDGLQRRHFIRLIEDMLTWYNNKQ